MSITLRVAEITGSTYLECATLYVKEVPFESQCDAIESHYNFVVEQPLIQLTMQVFKNMVSSGLRNIVYVKHIDTVN